MPPHLALFVYIVFVLGLFWLDCRRDIAVSRGLWVPTVWLGIVGSRPLSLWFTNASISAQEAYLEGSPISRNAYLALIFAGLFILSRRKKKINIPELVAVNKALFLLLGYFALSISWSDFMFVSFKRYIKMLGMLLMLLIILTEVDPALALRTALRRCGFVLLLLSLMVAKYFPSIGINYNIWSYEPTWIGITSNKNMLGQICFLFGLSYLWSVMLEWKERRSTRHNRLVIAIDIFMLLITIHILILSDSATSLLCLFCGSAVMLATGYDSVRNNIGLYIAIGLLAFLSLNFLFDMIPAIAQALGRNPTMTGRTVIWERLLPIAKENLWFGSGYTMFWTPRVIHAMEGLRSAHNGYLEIMLDYGLVGLCLFFIFIASTYVRCRQAIRTNPRYGRFAMAFFLSALLYNFSEAAFRGIDNVFFILLAISLSLSETGKEHGS